ncbi:MAG: hypothetical protein AB1733_19240 [Thermodesulfobacteriota bacterium]
MSSHCRRHLGAPGQEETLQILHLTLSDEDLIKAIDMMKLDIGETEIRVQRCLPEAFGSLNLMGVPAEDYSARSVKVAIGEWVPENEIRQATFEIRSTLAL